MKARVKHNNKIIDVIQVGTRTHLYDLNNVEIIDEPDYWTRLEHHYAGMAMQGILVNEKMMLDLHQAFGKNESMDVTISEFAVDIAHTLVEKMKEERK